MSRYLIREQAPASHKRSESESQKGILVLERPSFSPPGSNCSSKPQSRSSDIRILYNSGTVLHGPDV